MARKARGKKTSRPPKSGTPRKARARKSSAPKPRAPRAPRVTKYIGDTPAERRAARKAAREECKAEAKRLKTWVPAERKRVAAEIEQLKAEHAQHLTNTRAQLEERIKATREELQQRIKSAKASAKLGVCVDMKAPPGPRQFGPRAPYAHQRGAQQALLTGAPERSGGHVHHTYRVHGITYRDEPAALKYALKLLKVKQGGIVTLERRDDFGQWYEAALYGLDDTGKALRELDPSDPHGHHAGRAAGRFYDPDYTLTPRGDSLRREDIDHPALRPPRVPKESARPKAPPRRSRKAATGAKSTRTQRRA